MKRRGTITKLREAAVEAGRSFDLSEGGSHTRIKIGDKRSTIGRHNEIDDLAARKLFKQFEGVLGEGWWK